MSAMTKTVEKMTITVVPFDYSDAHYAAAVANHNAVWPQYLDLVEDWKYWDGKRNPDLIFKRFLAQNAAGDFVAEGGYGNMQGNFHPQKFWINVDVHPDYQQRGVGSQFYRFLMEDIAQYDPAVLDCGTREDKAHALRFLATRGFEVKTVENISNLELERFDPARFATKVAKFEQSGLEIIDLNEARKRFPETYLRKVYEMGNAIMEDVPWHDDFTPQPFDQFVKKFVDSPRRIDECYLIALDGDQFAGVTMLFNSKADPQVLYTGLSGVLRDYRRKGVVTALKVRALSTAKEKYRLPDGGYPYVTTENEKDNPMYQINVLLGFEKQPCWMAHRKTIKAIAETEEKEG